jgi:ABC-type nitrate/sulfonate/bicarbonate transport system ATPase subunit/ABC-type nitrate/sulfonate/bicarbonate transport system permease component
MKRFAFYSSGIIIIFLLWMGISFLYNGKIIPWPWTVFHQLLFRVSRPGIYMDLFLTVTRSLTGFILALAVGIGLGIVSGKHTSFEQTIFLPTILLQGAPPILWIIPLMLLLGTTGASPVAVVFLVVLPLVITNIRHGMKEIKKSSWEMMTIYGNSPSLRLTHLILPSLGGYIKSSILLGIVLGLKSSLVGEWFGAENGIGRRINESFYIFDMPSFFSFALLFLITLGIISYLTHLLLRVLFSRGRKIYTPSITLPISKPDQVKISSKALMENLFFSYDKEWVLSNITYVHTNEKPAVITGESGVGKTTFAKCLCGLLHPCKGRIVVPSLPGMLFQEDVFLEQSDCLHNVMLPGKWRKEKNMKEKAAFYLSECGLKDAMNFYPGELSGGMRNRLALARALMLCPDFIILDEPFSQLHYQARQELWDLFFWLFVERHIPSLIITHYPEELSHRDVNFYELTKESLHRATK